MPSTSYLQLRDRLSQVWINQYLIFLILIALKLILFNQSIQASLKLSKYYTLNSCPTIDSFASNAISLPHYLSKSANYMLLKSLEELNEKSKQALKLILTGSENLIIFAIEMVVGTYACVLVATIDGAVDVAVNSTEKVIGWVNDTLGDITDDIDDGLTDLSKFINKIADAADDIKDFFTGDDDDSDDANSTLSKINLSVISLKDLTIPGSINDKLEALKENTPDFDTVKNKTENLIKMPFELIKDKIDNTTLIDSDDSLYVPPITKSTICSGNSDKINQFYDNVSNDITKIVKIFVVLLILVAICTIIPICYEEYRKWRKLKLLQDSIDESKDVIESYETIYNKIPYKIGSFFSSKLSSNEINRIKIRWFGSYCFSSRSLAVLGIALTGISAVVLQFIILSICSRAISKHESPFNDMTNELLTTMDDSISDWTTSTNEFLETKETDMNDDLFSWVKSSTDSINDTISSFVDEMNEVINDAFNGTILYSPVKTIVGCVIEDKLLKIEKGLTWIHDNSQINLPRVNETYILQGISDDDNNSTDSSNTDLVSKSSDLVKNVEDMMGKMMRRIVKQYRKSLMVELYISVGILIAWVAQMIVGLVLIWIDTYHKNGGLLKDVALKISYPRDLTKNEKLQFGYPYIQTPKDVIMKNTWENKVENPFDDKLEKYESNETYRTINPFDDSMKIPDFDFGRKNRKDV